MNLHESPKFGYPRNTRVEGLDWNPGWVVLVDEQYECNDVNQTYCYQPNGVRGHGQNCITSTAGAQDGLREWNGFIVMGIYQCECGCHEEDGLCVYGTYIEHAGNITLFGLAADDRDRYLPAEERGLGYRVYWCDPCRKTNHHWTE